MKKINCIRALLFIALIGCLSTPSMAGSRFIGMNTNEAVHFNASLPFADLFRMAEPFKANKAFTRGNIVYDENGWVKNLRGGQAGTWFLRWIPAKAFPQGHYVVRYEGSGSIRYHESAVLIKRSPGRDIIRLRPDANNEISAALIIQKSDPNNPIRNIQITLPGGICANNPFRRVDNADQCGNAPFQSFEKHVKDIVFNPDYLNFMREFGTVRFMPMSGITRNPMRHWSQRPHLEEATWGGNYAQRGVPLEIMVKLANTTNADPWFNMPHAADDDFVRRSAQYVKENLRPHLRAHIEYTNEAWNGIFSQAQYVQRMGLNQKLDNDPMKAGLKYYAKRSKEIFHIWNQVFENDRRRLLRVLAGWSGNPSVTPLILKSFDVYETTDYFAIAPYFYAPQEQLMRAKSVDEIFELIYANHHYSVPKTLSILNQHQRFLDIYGVALVAYEGGQHLVHHDTSSKKQHPNPLLIAANRDPRMEKAYIELLKGFRQAGGRYLSPFLPLVHPPFLAVGALKSILRNRLLRHPNIEL